MCAFLATFSMMWSAQSRNFTPVHVICFARNLLRHCARKFPVNRYFEIAQPGALVPTALTSASTPAQFQRGHACFAIRSLAQENLFHQAPLL